MATPVCEPTTGTIITTQLSIEEMAYLAAVPDAPVAGDDRQVRSHWCRLKCEVEGFGCPHMNVHVTEDAVYYRHGEAILKLHGGVPLDLDTRLLSDAEFRMLSDWRDGIHEHEGGNAP